VGNEIPRDVRNPLVDVVAKNLLEGKVSINPVPFSHFEGYDIHKLANIESWDAMINHNSFNLGELLFPHSLLSLVPLLLFFVGGGGGGEEPFDIYSPGNRASGLPFPGAAG